MKEKAALIEEKQRELLMSYFPWKCGEGEWDNVQVPPIVDPLRFISDAKAFRDKLHQLCEERVCSVCGMYKRTMDLEAIEDIPNAHLIIANDDSLTTAVWKGERYILQRAGVGTEFVNICRTCQNQLDKGVVS